MAANAKLEVKEDLAQLGIKKGSVVAPLVAMVLAAFVVLIYVQPTKTTLVDDYFTKVCEAARGLKLPATTLAPAMVEPAPIAPAVAPADPAAKAPAPGAKQTAPKAPVAITEQLALDCIAKQPSQSIADIKDKFTARKSPDSPVSALDVIKKLTIIAQIVSVPGHPDADMKIATTARGWWDVIVEVANSFLRELVRGLIGDWKGITWDLLKTATTVGLLAMVPGIAGMIYRRNFWGWFLVPFVLLFPIAAGSTIRLPQAQWLIFFAFQALLILLAFRLHRHSRSSNFISASLQNWLLFAAVLLVGIAILFKEPTFLWTSLIPEWVADSWFYRLEILLIVLPVLYTLLRRTDAWTGTAPKNIVVCLDGTSNTPDQLEHGRLAQTNVFKLFKMLKADPKSIVTDLPSNAFNASLSKRYKDKQIAFYYSGVGNKFEYDPIVQTLGLASGLGASAVVDRAYLDIVRVYRPGDKIFVFGFSRGAAIARMLARAVDARDAPRSIWTVNIFGRHWTLWKSKLDPLKRHDVPIAVLGCFDTVGAFGIGKKVAGIDFQQMDAFKDLTVPDNVEQAYHMVALDEEREEFRPTLMDPDPIQPARLVEVWFAGDHANIGGGWGTTELSDLTLEFLLQRISSGYAYDTAMMPGAETWGLYLSAVNAKTLAPNDPQQAGTYIDIDRNRPFQIRPDALGQVRQWRSAVYVYKPRELPNHAVLSESIFQRMAQAAPLYAPSSLFNLHEQLDKRRSSVASSVKRLTETASLSSEEFSAIKSFTDKLHLTRWPQYWEMIGKTLPASERPEVRLANKA
jgi:hypothetical protein